MCRSPEVIERPDHPGSWMCVNCSRSAYLCPICQVHRCEWFIHMSMIGHFPLACTTCRPNGIRQSMTLGMGPGFGPYREGTRLDIDDPDIPNIELTDPR